MNIMFLHERFIFRYGVDRVLMSLAEEAIKYKHKVAFLGFKFDKEHLTLPGKSYELPFDEKNNHYLDLDQLSTRWIKNNWMTISEKINPDLIINGGWPFYSSMKYFKNRNVPILFLDFGVVPTNSLNDSELLVGNKIRELRKQYLSFSDLISPISNYLACELQKNLNISNIKVNHLAVSDVFIDALAQNNTSAKKKQEIFKVLVLGRWEPNNYKNSNAAFNILNQLIERDIHVNFVILANKTDVSYPSYLENHLTFVGHPNDTDLANLMMGCDAGVTTSLWEGFNLPLAEMQSMGKPVFAFNVAAHPEVIIHSWFLCNNEMEMVKKLEACITKRINYTEIINLNLKRYKSIRRWKNVWKNYSDLINYNIFSKNTKNKNSLNSIFQIDDYYPQLIIHDVTNSTKDPANSGVIRVTRKLAKSMQNTVNPMYVVFDDNLKTYVFPTRQELDTLKAFNGPIYDEFDPISESRDNRIKIDESIRFVNSNNRCLLFSETTLNNRVNYIEEFADRYNIKKMSIFYDAIPITHPEFVVDSITRENHGNYMKNLAKMDIVLSISNNSQNELKKFWKKNQLLSFAKLNYLHLPADLSEKQKTNRSNNQKLILCVSTIEPRKNHIVLLSAFSKILHQFPDWKLVLVGNRYSGAEGLAREIELYCHKYNQIEWRGVISDQELTDLYARCSFTIYPSLVEGFGLPIIESLYFTKPCICSQEGVMAEIASAGGCLTTDVNDVDKLQTAITVLISNEKKLTDLTLQASKRTFISWDNYAIKILEIIRQYSGFLCDSGQIKTDTVFTVEKSIKKEFPSLTQLLYPDCIFDNWQMNDSERIGLTGVLSRINPIISIEIGTFKAGSLSLIRQYSKHVFSLDIDETIPVAYSNLNSNVSYLTGKSGELLPLLLKEITDLEIPLGFILVDGDHSYEGLLNDINIVLKYEPICPLIIMCHDSFHPETRRAMLDADWSKNPYVQKVDIDFIPGRVIEHGGLGDGELWGGLSLIYLTPKKRIGKLTISQTAVKMQKSLNKLK